MAKEEIIAWLHEPLAAVLGTRAKVAVLRVLWRAATPIPYREVVRRSGMAYGSVALALRDLTATGLVEELAGGRERRVQFCSAHRFAPAVGTLLQVDGDYFAGLRVELRAIARHAQGDGLVAAAMVGAAARREERLSDPVELVLVARDGAAVARISQRFDAAEGMLRGRFGVRLLLHPYPLDTAQLMWRTRTAAAVATVRSAESLVGPPLELLLGGGAPS
jgi:DNA-binding transcriptional ArsR family regulator